MSNKKPSASRKKMSDIARLAGVSESTVSRALNDNPLIKEETRRRIQALAAQHNYTINTQARNLRLQSSRTISVVIPMDHEPGQHVSDPFFMELLGAIADGLTEADYDLLLSRVHRRDWRARVASHSHVDGMIIIGQSDLHHDINDFAKHSNMPMVVWGAHLPDQLYVSVGSDNLAGGRLAGEHLLKQERTKIVFLGDPELPEVALRLEGVRDAHRECGIEFNPTLIYPCGFTAESAQAAMQEILIQKPSFDAIFAASDVLASTAIKCLGSAGLAVPKDIAVVGYDDISIAQHMSPGLTTVSQNIQQSGVSLVANLFRQVRGESTTSEIYPPSLVIRTSA